jgi:hypothetical protein
MLLNGSRSDSVPHADRWSYTNPRSSTRSGCDKTFCAHPLVNNRHLFAVLETITQYKLRKLRSVFNFYTKFCPLCGTGNNYLEAKIINSVKRFLYLCSLSPSLIVRLFCDSIEYIKRKIMIVKQQNS